MSWEQFKQPITDVLTLVGDISAKTQRTKLLFAVVFTFLGWMTGDILLATDARLSVVMYGFVALVIMRYMESQGAVDVEKAKKTS